jgi:hypothetical protein
MMATLSLFTNYNSVATATATSTGKKVTLIQLEQEIDLKRFEQVFPDTFDDFQDLLTSISTKTKILTEDNLIIGRFDYNAETHVFSANIALSNGGFMLQNDNGDLSNKIIFPTQLESLNYKIKTDANVSMYGLDIDIENILVDSHFFAGKVSPKLDRTSSINMKMTTIPSVEVHGAFLYFIPYWLIDLLIPGTLETLIAEAFEDAVTGNNSQGFSFDLLFEEKNNTHNVSLTSGIEIPHKLLQAILKIEDAEHTQRPRLYQTLRRNIREDFAQTASPYGDLRIINYLSNYTTLKQ